MTANVPVALVDCTYAAPPLAAARPLHVAFVGCGRIAARHAAGLRRLDVPVALSFCSRDPARARAFAARLPGARAHADEAAMLADADVDAVFVTTPPHRHRDDALRALAAGKHVIVEKPPFANVATFDRVLAAARQASRRLLVAENYYYKPLRRTLAQWIGGGVIGQLRCAYVNALKLQEVAADDWRADSARALGGALFEGGIHWISLLANVGLRPERVVAAPLGDSVPDRGMVVTLQYAEGGSATLYYGWNTPSPLQGLRLSRFYGSDGAITCESNGLFAVAAGRHVRLGVPGLRDINGAQAMRHDFVHALMRGSEPAYTTALARRDLAIVEAAYVSALGAPLRDLP